MVDLSFEQCALYASCFALGIFAGYHVKKPLRVFTHSAFKEPSKLVLVVRDDLKMSRGKMMGQCCHATLSAYMKTQATQPQVLNHWIESGQAKVVVKANNLEEMLRIEKVAADLEVFTCLIRDAGRTQLDPGTETVLSVGPDIISNIDKITGHLKLL